jgi:hypothetical protein
MTHFRRKIIATFSVVLLLFTQFAVTTYACPSVNTQSVGEAAIQKAALQPCQMMDHAHPMLCKQHCEKSAQSVDSRVQAKVDLPLQAVVWNSTYSTTNSPSVWSDWITAPPNLTCPPLYRHHSRFLI